jgi:hypothetical protein
MRGGGARGPGALGAGMPRGGAGRGAGRGDGGARGAGIAFGGVIEIRRYTRGVRREDPRPSVAAGCDSQPIPRSPSVADDFIANSNLTGSIGVFVVGSISGQRPSLDGGSRWEGWPYE